MIVIFAALHAKSGRRAELTRGLDAIRAEAESEPGTLAFAVHIARDDENLVLCYEAYRDDDAIAAHREGRALLALMDSIGEMIDGPPEIQYATMVGGVGVSTS